jgi:hypothetical protein
MISPMALEMMSKAYLQVLSEYEGRLTVPNDAQPSDVDNVNAFTYAQDLWDEIDRQVESSEWFQLIVQGHPGSGKSTVMRELAHIAHQSGYYLIYISGYELGALMPKLIEAKKKSAVNKYCVITDDISYLMQTYSGKKSGELKNIWSMLRHVLKGKVLFMSASHFTSAIPPMMRNTDMWVFTDPTNTERENFGVLVGKSKDAKAELQTYFEKVQLMKASAAQDPVLNITYSGHDYSFHWDKDGRISLLLQSGRPSFYVSQNVSCPECQHIGVGKIDPQMLSDRPKEDAPQ